jgi:hypothetical protein
MKKYSIILFMLVSASVCSYAQTVKTPQPDSLIKVIPFGEGKNSSYLYTVGGKLQAPEDVKIRLMSYEPSATELRAAQNNVTWTFVFFGATAMSTTGAAIEFYKNSKSATATAAFVNGRPGFVYSYPHNNKTFAYVLTGAAIAFATTAFITLVRGGKHAKKAVDVYNMRFQ